MDKRGQDAHSPASWLGPQVASHRTQWIKNPRIYHSSHLPLRLCVFARGNLYTTAPLTAAASLPIHSSRLRVFSRKGAKTQSFSELRNSEFLATRYVGDCYISNAVPDPDAPAPSIISASPSVTSDPLRFVEFRPQGPQKSAKSFSGTHRQFLDISMPSSGSLKFQKSNDAPASVKHMVNLPRRAGGCQF